MRSKLSVVMTKSAISVAMIVTTSTCNMDACHVTATAGAGVSHHDLHNYYFIHHPSTQADPIFDACTVLALVIFAIDLFVSSLGKDDYYLSFFFYLDLVATLSLILDITTVAAWIAGAGGDSTVSDGTQAAKILRILRLIRLIRIVKLYKQYIDQQQRKRVKAALEAKRKRMKEEGLDAPRKRRPGEEESLLEIDDDELAAGGIEEDAGSESRVGKKLSDMTTRRVIILVLTMLLIVPQFQLTENFSNYQTAGQYGSMGAWFRGCLVDLRPVGGRRRSHEHA